jgi:hypothetical protein
MSFDQRPRNYRSSVPSSRVNAQESILNLIILIHENEAARPH